LDNVNERAQLLQRQRELETAMKQQGGARVTDEQELHTVRRRLRALHEAARIADGTARAARCSLADFAPRDPNANPLTA
jgi:hypothetical protein